MAHRSFFFLFITLFFCSFPQAIARDKKQEKGNAVTGIPAASLLNINNISSWYENNTRQEGNPITGNSGLTFPRGTTTAVFLSGLMFGAYCNDGAMPATQPRISGESYSTGFYPGAIIGNRTGVTEDPAAADVRIWRIRRDYATADLRLDAAEINMTPEELINDTQIADLRLQYKKDWQEWPAHKGAPFYDANNDGIYSPQFETVGGIEVPKRYPAADEPGLANADQVLWYVANDIRLGESPWKTKPLGLEQQVTIWGYNRTDAVGNMLFKKFKYIYKGTATTPANGVLSNAYIAHWSDPDLGDAGDDFVGCDTTLNLGYTYNATGVDREYQKYHTIPPSVGFSILQGPVIPSPNDTAIVGLSKRPGFKNLPMTSFLYFAGSGNYTDPPFNFYGSWQWYSLLQGFPPTPQPPPFPKKIIDPKTLDSTFFWLSGDPVINPNPLTNPHWIDGLVEKSGDRRTIQSSGPFAMALGDTQEIVVGVIGGIGENYLQSIAEMKKNSRIAKTLHQSLFELIPPDLSANVTYPLITEATIQLTATSVASKYSSIKAIVLGSEVELLDDGAHNDGLAADGVYANTVSVPRSQTPVSVDLALTTPSNTMYKIPSALQYITVAGPLSVENPTIYFDNINNDGIVNNGEYVHFGITVKNNSLYTLKNIKVGIFSPIDFHVERKYGDISAGTSSTLQYNSTSLSTYYTFRLPLHFTDPKYGMTAFIGDDNGNLWKLPFEIPVVQQPFLADSLIVTATNIVGQNDGRVGFVLYNPALAGETYDIWYGGIPGKVDWTVVKNLPSGDYAKLTSVLRDTNEVPRLNTYPNAAGEASFTINDTKTEVKYAMAVSGLSGPITFAGIYNGARGANGPLMYPLIFAENTSVGVWTIADSLVDDFTAGNLYVNILTAANPTGEIRGQIADGLLPRQAFPSHSLGNNVFVYQENRLIGFSLFVGWSPVGVKSVMQTAPTQANVLNVKNPENTYRIVDKSNTSFNGSEYDEGDIRIEFLPGTHWAITAAPLPSLAKFIRVPFAVYKDTIRVMPVIANATTTDTLWNTDAANGLWNGKPMFDAISGICDNLFIGVDISYYSPLNIVFPPTQLSMKARYINYANHIAKNITVVNETGDGAPPAHGTKILFSKYISVKSGDIKSFSLQPLSIPLEQISTIPEDYALMQNYPNPFNPVTKIEFSLPHQSHVSLKVFDVVGREVSTLVNDVKPSGNYRVHWDGKNRFGQPAASGVYFYRMLSGNFVQSRKMILLK